MSVNACKYHQLTSLCISARHSRSRLVLIPIKVKLQKLTEGKGGVRGGVGGGEYKVEGGGGGNSQFLVEQSFSKKLDSF